MWTFILIYILGLNIGQTTGRDNSTQMHYVKLTIDLSVIPNITDLLKDIVNLSSLKVENLTMTTTCKNVSDGSYFCTCQPGYRWSDQVCKSQSNCCDRNCTFLKRSSQKCVSDNAVTVSGSVTLEGEYGDCLKINTSSLFRDCNNKLIREMQEVYSTLRGFDSLTISKYRFGSIIADFEMFFAYKFRSEDLIQKTKNLSKGIRSSFILNTKGFVRLTMPPNPVHYNSQHDLNCSVEQDLGTKPVWQLKRDNETHDINSGTEAIVTTTNKLSNIRLSNISALWAGEYSCVYKQSEESEKSSYTILHKASSVMDVCLKPMIDIRADPSFPRCTEDSDSLRVKVRCEIERSSKHYSVIFNDDHDTSYSQEKGVFTVETFVFCNRSIIHPLNCSFTNRCNQTTSASVNINFIRGNDPFCEAEGDWEVTKVGFTAELKCQNKAGKRQRKCKHGKLAGEWEPEVSECVNKDVFDIMHKAEIVDIGLGSVTENVASVFSRLQNVTNKTETINTFANLNTSVNVLFTLSQKPPPQHDQAVDDFLGSSSNLLDRSLNKSWETNADESKISLAERYLSSVEHLIHSTNITRGYGKKNVEVAARNCSEKSECINKVFNNTVDLEDEDPGSVKTAGFKELEKYLPNNFNKTYNPNSIVVSTTTERNHSDSVKVKISFQLLTQRPPNVEMICVSWDNKTRGWSNFKCKSLRRTGSEGTCVCEHLSSFAILMGKSPLKVPFINEITYVALSVSIISLIITLVIEIIVWTAVVKTNTLYLRHTAHINICLCLLVADCCFLASSKPHDLLPIWCKTFVVVKHFCYLSMFFWMLCLSSMLLHQTVFLFHNVSKKNYLRFAFFLGYICPLLIITITIINSKGFNEGWYYSKETCWLVYTAPFKGSIHTFILPVGIIVFFNVFSMVVVILKLLDFPKNKETTNEKDRKAAIIVLRSVVLLTPIFGVTWFLGFAVIILDLADGVTAYIANYAFTLLNGFQGFYILLTACLGDKMTREELLRRLKPRAPASINNSTTESTLKD